jgi:hypothetical protein
MLKFIIYLKNCIMVSIMVCVKTCGRKEEYEESFEYNSVPLNEMNETLYCSSVSV